jgi:beta-phosphoglucomutase-like phosphatase (HAD superfamily)
MRVYVDFDDVLCETARDLAALAGRLFGCRIAYEEIRAFDLRHAFGIDDGQHARLMELAHEPSFLLGLPPTPGAVEVLAAWRAAGWRVCIVTGRPPDTEPASRQWLAAQGLPDQPLLFVDKYRRHPPAAPGAPRALQPEELSAHAFDLAVEDAPAALDQLARRDDCRTLIFDRPWNRDYVVPPGARIARGRDWAHLDALVRTFNPPKEIQNERP